MITTRFLDMIEVGYAKSNTILLDLFLKDRKLIDRLRSIKTFFLLDQSDYLTHFLDLASPHLSKPANSVSLPKLNSILELVIQSSSTMALGDSFKDDLTIEMSPLSLFDQLIRINSMVGIDMKKHLENLRAGRPFDLQDPIASSDEFAGVASGPLSGIMIGILINRD